jgi:hypothetical protein
VLCLAGVVLALVLLVLLPWATALHRDFYLPANCLPSSSLPQPTARQLRTYRLRTAVEGMKFHDLEKHLGEYHCAGAGLAATVPEMRELLKACLVEADPLPSPPLSQACPLLPRPGEGRPPVYLEFADVRVSVPGKALLHAGIRGCVGAGQITAVMGGSGSGKTTLVSVLRGVSGADKVVRGVVSVSGGPEEPIGPALRRFRADGGYVPQNDVMYRWAGCAGVTQDSAPSPRFTHHHRHHQQQQSHHQRRSPPGY